MKTKKRLLALNLVLVLLLTLVPSTALADEVGVAVDALNFPDDAFRNYISANCDADGNGFLSAAEIANVTGIYVTGEGISSLEGLRYFTALSILICDCNPLGSLPELPSSLTYLACSDNKLTSLPELPNSLTALHCSYNQLTSLPELPNSLTSLGCSGNQLTSLPDLPSTLTELYCSNNQLTSLPELPSSLTSLDCGSNQLISLPDLPNGLTRFTCSSLELTSLPELPSSLTYLACSDNKLTSLPELPDGLTLLYCYNNKLESLPELPSNLASLDCSENQFTALPDLPNGLTRFTCSSLELTSLPKLPSSLTSLDCRYNQLTSLPELPSSLTSLDCIYNQLTSLPELPSSLTYLNCSVNQLTEINLNPDADYNFVYVGNNKLPNREAVTGQTIDWTKDGFNFGVQDHEHVFKKMGTDGMYTVQGCVNCDYSGSEICTHEDGAALDANGVCSVCGTLVTSLDANGEFKYTKNDDKALNIQIRLGFENGDYYYTQMSENVKNGEMLEYRAGDGYYTTFEDLLLWDKDLKACQFYVFRDYTYVYNFKAEAAGEYSVKFEKIEPEIITQPGTYSFDGSKPFEIYYISIPNDETGCLHFTLSGNGRMGKDGAGITEAYYNYWYYTGTFGIPVRTEGEGAVTVAVEEHDWQEVAVLEPTCEEAGYENYRCSKCNGYDWIHLDMLGHDFDENGVCSHCGKYRCEVNTDPIKHIYDENGVCTRCGLSVPDEYTSESGARYSMSADGTFSVYYPSASIYDSWEEMQGVKNHFAPHLQNVRKVVYEEGTIAAINYQLPSVEEMYISSTVRKAFPELPLRAPLLRKITVADNNPYYCSVDGVLYSKDMKTLMKYPAGAEATSFDIPYGVTEISCNAFQDCNLEHVYMPDSVTVVGADAFCFSRKLRSVRLSNNVTKLDGTFRFCASLESVVIPDSVTEMTWVFHGCDNLKNVKLPENLKILDHNFEMFFTKMPDIRELYLPASLELMIEAFYGFEEFHLYYGGTEQQWNDLMEKTREIIGASFDVDKNVTVHFLDDAKTVESGSDAGIGVSVTPIGDKTIGENVNLSVSRVEAENASLIVKQTGSSKFAAYDISLVDALGNEAQIESGYALVKLTVPEGFDASECAVYRVEADGTLTDMGAALVDGKLQFATEHFSTYVVVEKSGCTHENMTVSVIPASCTKDGYTIYTCPDCGYSRTGNATAATGHKTELCNAVEAACTEDGYTGDEVCTVCGETVAQGEKIEATGHHYDGKVCTDCGHKMTAGESIKAWFNDTIQNVKNFFDKIFGRH